MSSDVAWRADWWRTAPPADIPTKSRLHRAFLTALGQAEAATYERYNTAALVDLPLHERRSSEVRRVLDIGCGDGRITCALCRHGLEVVGMDLNTEAVAAAAAAAAADPSTEGRASFVVGDCSAQALAGGDDGSFDVVLAQLVISIIGDPGHRRNLIRNAWAKLRPGGTLLLSASAVSSDINPQYVEAYVSPRSLRMRRHFPRRLDASAG
jgi:2-polyprenyl-3-methyl-5-hydroxy-6-metoxy-1,4-benzoquinol methylase